MFDRKDVASLPRSHQRLFLALLTVTLLLLLLIDWMLWGAERPKGFARTYVQALATAILSGLFLFWVAHSFLPAPQSKRRLMELPADEISAAFDQMLNSATRWRYRGNFGRYLRGKVLPALSMKPNMHISVCLIDPGNEDLCSRHASYRNDGNPSVQHDAHNAETVATEVVATIVVCSWHAAKNRTKIDLTLTSTFDPVRMDASDDCLILTVEDRQIPAIQVFKDHFAYKNFDLQMTQVREQARKIELFKEFKAGSLLQIKKDEIESVLKHADLADLIGRISISKVLIACKSIRNPYGN